MITCNGSGNPDAIALGIDKRLRALSHLSKEEGELLRAYVNNRPELLHYRSIHTFHCLYEDRVRTYFLVGLENKPLRYSMHEDFLAAKRITAAAMSEGVTELAVFIDTLEMDMVSLIDGLLYRNYAFNRYKREAEEEAIKNINLITSSLKIKDFNTLCYVYSSIYEGVYLARDLVNTPSNDLTPRRFCDLAATICKGDNMEVEVMNKWNLEKRNMGGIVAVGKGSMNPPQLLTLSYKGDPDSRETVAVVGKGIIYDSGGLSLKSHAALEFMKDDMAGAAAALGVMRALMLLKYPINVVAVMPLAENVPSSMSYRVDDVITMYDGHTVEIKNTDAEGRLILADAVTYAQEKGAIRIIDLATLTGACVTALGTIRSGMFGNDQEWMNRFFAAAGRAHEKVWQLPLDREYEEELKSTVADLKNVGSTGSGAGAIVAAQFIKQFVKPETAWIHLDIAGTAFSEKKDESGFSGATGVGVKTILEFLRGGR